MLNKRTLIHLLFVSLCVGDLGCIMEKGEESGGSGQASSDTGPAYDGAWAVGRYYQPPYTTVATSEKPSINIREDFTAVLEMEFCKGEAEPIEVHWKAIDEDRIEFSSAKSEEGLVWFGVPALGIVRMSRTDDPEIVVVSDGDNSEGVTHGEFRRGTACLVTVDEALGCQGGGAFVQPCEDVTGG